MGIERMIRDAVEHGSGYKISDFKAWEKKSYLADGSTVSDFWDLIETSVSVTVIGDYDVDGICASYIMASAINNVFPGKKIRIRIPRRFSEGYGINGKIAEEIRQKDKVGALIITVDNGIGASDILEDLEREGYKVAVTDHHAAEADKIPKVSFVIDPAAGNMDIPLSGGYWCGAGIALKLTEQYTDDATRQAAEVFAAVATVADCVPLIEGNWALVKKALHTMQTGKAPAQINVLLDTMGQSVRFCNESMIGFYLAPALNAPGRLLDKGGAMVLSYLLSPNMAKAREIASINEQRKKIRDEQYDVVRYTIRTERLERNCPIWLNIPGLHEGIVGILAGMIAEDYGVPAIVMTQREDGTLKGSARTAGDIDIFQYLSSLKEKADPVSFLALGGHEGAAGLSMTAAEYEKARQYFLPEPGKNASSENYIYLRMEEIPEAWDEVSKYVPYGEKNPRPLFATKADFQSDNAKMLGTGANHLVIEDTEGEWKVTHFNHIPNDLENKELFYIAGPIELTAFRGEGMPTLAGETVFDVVDVKEKTR